MRPPWRRSPARPRSRPRHVRHPPSDVASVRRSPEAPFGFPGRCSRAAAPPPRIQRAPVDPRRLRLDDLQLSAVRPGSPATSMQSRRARVRAPRARARASRCCGRCCRSGSNPPPGPPRVHAGAAARTSRSARPAVRFVSGLGFPGGAITMGHFVQALTQLVRRPGRQRDRPRWRLRSRRHLHAGSSTSGAALASSVAAPPAAWRACAVGSPVALHRDAGRSRLEARLARRREVDVLVIDRIERPSENWNRFLQ